MLPPRRHPDGGTARLRDPAGWLAVALAVAWVTRVRVGLLSAGPDLDSDAAAHAMIGRRLATEWRDVAIHWVWLPLWHVVHAAAAGVGGDIETVRALSVACGA